jgi:aromatic ring-cleaving dioxygenase
MRLPDDWITSGYDIHVVYTPTRQHEARALRQRFLSWLADEGIPFQRPIDFPEPVGPWPTAMWQVLLKNPDPTAITHDLGRCVAWLMINRGALSVMIHPNTTPDGEFGGHLADHSEHRLWMGEPQELRLEIFR